MLNSSDFDRVLDPGERELWTGRPHWLPFLISGVPGLLGDLAWGAFDYF